MMGNKKLFYGIFIIAVIVLGYYVIGYSLDPFGAPPKGTSPNCGPEDRYKFDVIIDSEQDFIRFLQDYDGKILNKYGANWVRLDNFRNIQQGMNYTEISQAEVNWDKVLDEVKIEKAGFRTVYALNYNPFSCSGFTLKMTNDGHVSVYGCCGK